MRRILLITFCLYLSIAALAQTAPQKITIKGVVIDSVTNKPLPYVTVNLSDLKTKQAIKSTLTKEDGGFELKGTAVKAYNLVFSFVGYKGKAIVINGTSPDVNMGKVLLQVANKGLKEVSVTAAKPLIKQEIDRIGYDVQADPESKSLNVLDMLRKVPLVTVDASDNILLKGGSSYKVLINGRSSSLVAHNPSDVFKAMPASSIQKIEIITIPPAKYDAEGLAGIINIITNRKVDEGYNGTLNSRYSNLSGLNNSASVNAKEGRLGLSAYSSFNDPKNIPGSTSSSLQTFGANPSYLMQSGNNDQLSKFHYTSAELSYEIDSLNLLNFEYSSVHSNVSLDNNQFTQLFGVTNNILQSYRITSASNSKPGGTDLGLNYQLGFKRNKNQLLTLSYKYSKTPYDNDNTESIYDRFNYGQPSYLQHNNSGTNEQTIQADYVHPLKKINIEGGLKAILRSSFSNFETNNLDSIKNIYVADPGNSNNFHYNQDVYSFYNDYQLNLNNWGFKGGLRIERTVIDADFTSTSSVLNQGYNNLIPSIAIQRRLKGNASFIFGFTNRIERPDITELNPFVNKQDPKFISTGNPNLQPVLNHSFELNYSKFSKGSINIGLSYSFANNTIQNVTRLQDTVTFTTYQNLGSDRKLATNVSVNYPLTKKLSLTINGSVTSVWLHGFVSGREYDNQGIQGYSYSYTSYKISDNWRTGLSLGFYSSNVLLQGKSSGYVFSNLGITKDIFKKKGSVFFNVANPFTPNRTVTSFTSAPDFYQTTASRYVYRAFSGGINFRFGELKSAIKKNKRGINNDDKKASAPASVN